MTLLWIQTENKPSLHLPTARTRSTSCKTGSLVAVLFVMLTDSNRWDFVTRTFQMLVATVNPRSPSGEAFMVCSENQIRYVILTRGKDIQMRSMLAQQLILDTTGRLEQMNQSVGYNHDAGISFSEEIKAEARKLDE